MKISNGVFNLSILLSVVGCLSLIYCTLSAAAGAYTFYTTMEAVRQEMCYQLRLKQAGSPVLLLDTPPWRMKCEDFK